MIDCFRGIAMTHDWDIFVSGKNLGWVRVRMG